LYLLFNNTCPDSPVLIVLTVGIFFEPLVTVSKITFKADNMAAPTTTEYHFQTVDIVTKIKHKLSYKHPIPYSKAPVQYTTFGLVLNQHNF